MCIRIVREPPPSQSGLENAGHTTPSKDPSLKIQRIANNFLKHFAEGIFYLRKSKKISLLLSIGSIALFTHTLLSVNLVPLGSFLSTNFPLNKCIQHVALGAILALGRIYTYKIYFKGLQKILKYANRTCYQSHPNLPPEKLFYYTVLVPLLEESIFRGFLLAKAIKQGLVKGIFSNAMIYGLIHGPIKRGRIFDLMSVTNTTLEGILFASSSIITGTLWASVTAHAVHNYVQSTGLSKYF